MQNIIKHKRICAVSILLVLFLVIVGVMMFINKSKEAKAASMQDLKSLAQFAPFGIAPDEYLELMVSNNYCNDILNVKITAFNAVDGIQVGTLTGNLDFGEGAIKSFFKPGGPTVRRNLYAEVELSCPRGATLKPAAVWNLDNIDANVWGIRLEIVDKITNSTIRIIHPSIQIESAGKP